MLMTCGSCSWDQVLCCAVLGPRSQQSGAVLCCQLCCAVLCVPPPSRCGLMAPTLTVFPMKCLMPLRSRG